MSRFIREVQAELTGKQRHSNWRNLNVTQKMDSEVPFSIAVDRLLQVKIGVSWYVHTYCKAEEIEEAKKAVIRQLRKALYEDLEEPLYNLRMALFEYDMKAAQDAYGDLLDIIERESE